MSEYLQHGKFKYIDKWRSKTGKWVYKYRDDVSNDILSLKNGVGNRLAETRRYLVNKPKKQGSSKTSNWHDTGSDVILSKKKKYEESIKGHDKTRIRKVVDSSGKTSYRREYQDSAQQQNLSRKVKQYNDAIKPNSKVGRFIADFNDKYGPKYVHTISAHSGDGKNYVISYTKNLFGNRSVDVESYSYYDTKRKQRKRRRNKRRDAVKMDSMTGSLYLMHHGVKGQKWGIRRYQNSDGSYTDAGRERYGINNPLKNRYSKDVQSGRVDHNNPDHPDLKKGTRLYRISSKESDLGNKRLYVTYDEAKDRNYYLSGVWNPDDAKVLYEQYLEPVKDLKVASLPRVSKEAAAIYGNDPIKVGEAFTKGLIGTRLAGEPAELLSAYSKWDGTAKSLEGVKVPGYSSAQEISHRLYELTPGTKSRIVSNLTDRYSVNPSALYRDAADAVNGDPKAQKELSKRLKALGYHAQVDAGGLGTLQEGSSRKERSAGVNGRTPAYGGTANDPIIVFDSDKNLKERAKSSAVPKGTQAMASVLSTQEAYDQSYKLSQKSLERMSLQSEKNVKRMTSRAKAMKDSGLSISEISNKLGMSESAIKRYLYDF